MKVRALIKFHDLKESVLREIGDVFEVTEERYQEILENGGAFVEEVEDPEETSDPSTMSKAELIAKLEEMGVSEEEIKGKKKEDLIRLMEDRDGE